jgi:hypothetical protein
MSVRYDEPHRAAQAANTLIRWLAESGISIAGTRALRVRGRKTGKSRGVVVNVLTVDDVDYLVSPRAPRSGSAMSAPPEPSRWDRAGIVADSAPPRWPTRRSQSY